MKANNLILIGLPGSGKTTIGKYLAHILQWEHIDTDDLIIQLSGQSIPTLFTQGEAYFRQWERKAIASIPHKRNRVISTGGGVVTQEETMELLQEIGTLVYMERSIENILHTSPTQGRPLLEADPVKNLEKLYRDRKDLYLRYQNFMIDNNQSVSCTIKDLLTIIERLGGFSDV